MRVAFVTMETSHYRDTPGTRRFERIIGHLADRGHDVTVFCAKWWDGDDERVVRDGVIYRAVTVSPAPGRFAARLPGVLGYYGPDVIHMRPDPPTAVGAASLGRYLARAPLVVEWYGDEPIEGSRLSGRAATLPDLVITPSEMVRTTVRELGAPDDATQVVPESIDWSLLESTTPSDEIDVVTAHRLDASANVGSLLLGLAELRDREWTATIVGDGPERESFERQARDLRIEDRVTFAGDCDRQRRVALYKGAHAFVQTAHRSYFATELLRALACGCVGIVEYQAESSAHELVREHERSYRVTDPQELAAAIDDAGEYEHLHLDEDWEGYDHDAVLERYLTAYRDLAGEYGLL